MFISVSKNVCVACVKDVNTRGVVCVILYCKGDLRAQVEVFKSELWVVLRRELNSVDGAGNTAEILRDAEEKNWSVAEEKQWMKKKSEELVEPIVSRRVADVQRVNDFMSRMGMRLPGGASGAVGGSVGGKGVVEEKKGANVEGEMRVERWEEMMPGVGSAIQKKKVIVLYGSEKGVAEGIARVSCCER